MSTWNQIYFPDANTKMALNLFHYHDLVLVVMVVVLVLVLGFMTIFLFSEFFIGVSSDLELTKNEPLEFFWGTAPFVFLVFLGFVSLKNLYNMEVGEKVEFLVKVTGHQWYWEYRYEIDFNEMGFKEEYVEYVWNWLESNSLGFCDADFHGVSGYIQEGKNVLNEKSFEYFCDSLISKCGEMYAPWLQGLDEGKISVNSEELSNDSSLLYSVKSKVVEGEWGVVSLEDMLPLYNKCLVFVKTAFPFCDKLSNSFSELVESTSLAVNFFIKTLADNVNNSASLVSDFEGSQSILSGVSSLFMNGDWYYKYDSYIVPEDYLESSLLSLNSGFRNQDVSIPCYLARGVKNEVVISTADVFHSWGVGELGVKADAVPGRHNAMKVIPLQSGMAFGFCYELCGAGHSQMPITVFITNLEDIKWVIKSGIMASEYCSEFFSKMI